MERNRSEESVLVPMVVVSGVAVTVVDVVDVVSVLDRVVPAIGVVRAIVVALVHEMLTARTALVPVAVVLAVHMAFVQVVDVVVVAHLDVPAARAVIVRVLLVGVVLGGGHARLLCARIAVLSPVVFTRRTGGGPDLRARRRSDGA
jgi:hypothetical protein